MYLDIKVKVIIPPSELSCEQLNSDFSHWINIVSVVCINEFEESESLNWVFAFLYMVSREGLFAPFLKELVKIPK